MNENLLEQLHFVILKISSGAIAIPLGIMAGCNIDRLVGSSSNLNLYLSNLGGSPVTE